MEDDIEDDTPSSRSKKRITAAHRTCRAAQPPVQHQPKNAQKLPPTKEYILMPDSQPLRTDGQQHQNSLLPIPPVAPSLISATAPSCRNLNTSAIPTTLTLIRRQRKYKFHSIYDTASEHDTDHTHEASKDRKIKRVKFRDYPSQVKSLQGYCVQSRAYKCLFASSQPSTSLVRQRSKSSSEESLFPATATAKRSSHTSHMHHPDRPPLALMMEPPRPPPQRALPPPAPAPAPSPPKRYAISLFVYLHETDAFARMQR